MIPSFLSGTLSLTQAIALFFAAMLAAGINAVAGGGTFIAFPALLSTGISSLVANATCTVAVWPGSIASTAGYLKNLARYKHHLPYLGVLGLIGGWLGAELLLHTPEHRFDAILPYLMLTATLLFSFGKRITGWTSRYFDAHQSGETLRKILACVLMLLIAIYGGFFGAGIGILMLAMMQCMGMHDIHEMNALKTTLGITINGTAFITFISSGIVAWPQASVMIVGALIGGYGAARIALKLPQTIIRGFVMCFATALTLYFFIK
jgi:uncharacterized membrane protein YfcA